MNPIKLLNTHIAFKMKMWYIALHILVWIDLQLTKARRKVKKQILKEYTKGR